MEGILTGRLGNEISLRLMSQEGCAPQHIVLEDTDPRPHLWLKRPSGPRPSQGVLESGSIAGCQANLQITLDLDDPA